MSVLQHVNNSAERRMSMVNRTFRGVSTKYLQLYADWFKTKENFKDTIEDRSIFQKAMFSNHKSWDVYSNIETIYEAGVNDNPQSYDQVNMGNIQYDRTRDQPYGLPNFISRSKVDFIRSTNPMGQEENFFQRDSNLDDMRELTHNQWLADSTAERESTIANITHRRQARDWQLNSENGRLSRQGNTTTM